MQLLLLLVVLLSAGCSERVVAEESDYIVVATATSPNNLDARVGSDEASQKLHQLLYVSLFKLDQQRRVVPDLAASSDTPDERTCVVCLKRRVHFHDGRPLSAADVVYTFKSFLDPAFFSP